MKKLLMILGIFLLIFLSGCIGIGDSKECTPEKKCERFGALYCDGREWVFEIPKECVEQINVVAPINPSKAAEPFDWRGICKEGKFFRGVWDCFETTDDEKCNIEIFDIKCDQGQSHPKCAAFDGQCCQNENNCGSDSGCIDSESSVELYKDWLCFEGKWDKCTEEKKCNTRGDYYCNGKKWVLGTIEECDLEEETSFCEEGEFVRGDTECLETEDYPEICNTGRSVKACCKNENECFDKDQCLNASEAVIKYDNWICVNGLWDLCTKNDLCGVQEGFYCFEGRWIQGTYEECKERTPLTQQSCPRGQLFVGEWDCWQISDHKNCKLDEFNRGCCEVNQCFFGGQCLPSDAPLSEKNEWLCLEGKWDRCLEEQECFQRGSYFCHNGFWQNELPDGCE